jgi:hypothetical protein
VRSSAPLSGVRGGAAGAGAQVERFLFHREEPNLGTGDSRHRLDTYLGLWLRDASADLVNRVLTFSEQLARPAR